MNEEQFPNERLWIVKKIAEILVDLSDPEDAVGYNELVEQMTNVGEIILDGLGTEIIASNGNRVTVQFTDSDM